MNRAEGPRSFAPSTQREARLTLAPMRHEHERAFVEFASRPEVQVTWYENGKQRRRVFSIDLMGEQKALRAARKARAEVERQK